MAKSLQDQLMGAGLVDTKKAKKIKGIKPAASTLHKMKGESVPIIAARALCYMIDRSEGALGEEYGSLGK